MEAYAAFEELIKLAKDLKTPPSFVQVVVDELNFFKTQALCDLDRRADDEIIKARWHELERQIRGTNLLDQARRNHVVWPTVLAFTGLSDSKYTPPPEQAVPRRKTRKELLDALQPTEFFTELGHKISSANMKPKDKKIAGIGVKFLVEQAKHARFQQNHVDVLSVWRDIQPVLKKYDLLSEYKISRLLAGRIRAFLFDR